MSTVINNNPIAFDHVRDSNHAELHRLTRLHFDVLPDWMKTAEASEAIKQACTPLPATAGTHMYADYVERLYPCHTPASTFLSAMFFAEKQGAYQVDKRAMVQQRIDQAARRWGLVPAVTMIREKIAASQRDEIDLLPDTHFAYVAIDDDSGAKTRHYPMRNPIEIKRAAEYLQEHRDAFPFPDRQTMATKILVQVEKTGAAIGDALQTFLDRQAGNGLCNPREVQGMLADRARLAIEPELRTEILKMAELITTRPSAMLGPDTLTELAETVDKIDRNYLGLPGKYTDLIPRPEDVIFKLTYKEARAGRSDAVALPATGAVYDKTDFTRVKLADMAALFGQHTAMAVSAGVDIDPQKLASAAMEFGPEDGRLFEQLRDESGIRPITGIDPATAGLPAELRQRLAMSY